MAPPIVYYMDARSLEEFHSLSAHKPLKALTAAGLTRETVEYKNVCIKTHFGALKNVRYIRPSYIKFLVDFIKSLGGYPVVTESCGLGRPGQGGMYGGRTTEAEYLEVAAAHGFTPWSLGAPIYMLDGYYGTDYEIEKINGKHFKEVLVAGRLRESSVLILASHFKGHIQTGFGGALKNLGIGCVAKGAKGEAHSSKAMYINNDKVPDNLKKVKRAVKNCPTGALTLVDDSRVIRDESKCRRCRLCHSYAGEVFTSDQADPVKLCEQMIDNALGVVNWFKKRNGPNSLFYINYAVDIVQQCDCTAASDTPFVQDIGVLVSTDPVAVDQATVDLVNSADPLPNSILSGRPISDKNGKKELLSWIWPNKNEETGELEPNRTWEVQLKAAEKLGLGSRDYKLVKLEPDEE